MPLIPPRWLIEAEQTARGQGYAHEQLLVVLESYRNAPDYACPFENPTLECGDCGTRVMLFPGRREGLSATWWEVTACFHEKGHVRCQPIYQGHTRNRCKASQIMNGRSALPWVFDGLGG